MSRDAILERLRTARATVTIPRADAPAVTPFARRSTEECVQRFLLEAAAVGIECWPEQTPADVRARVQGLIAGLHVLSWDPGELPLGLGDLVSQATFGRSPREDQARADVGLTGCDAAIAETGSLAMISAPGRARAVSLLPPAHVAVVTPDQICFSMAEFFADRADRLRQAASCTFITGPSRTADIELTLTLGIHGPGRVAVVLGPTT
jgi:L-lactate dehydrogenase complex protein LldG